MNEIFCFNCNKALELQPKKPVFRTEECPYCYQKIHCCKMCRFYNSQHYNSCEEPQAERVLDKERVNFCDYFILKGGPSVETEKEQHLKDASAIFKNKG